jgi:tripartite-type tricarboxylate transporter receptor subunit TctC
MRTRIIGAVAIALSMLVSASGNAQEWPAKPVRLIAPAAAGGGLDAAARLVTDSLSKQLGQQFIVQNIAGVTTVGTAAAANAAPDGYTFLTATASPTILLPLLRKDLNYDPATAFVPVGLINESVSVLVVNPAKVPVKTLGELIDFVKNAPGKYDFASNGIGGESHLYMELLMLRTGVKLNHIPYKAGAEQLVAIMSGEVGITFLNSSTVAPHVQQGTVRGLAVVSGTRMAELPDVPAVSETIPTYGGYSTWQGVFARAGTPQPIVDKLAAALKAYIETPEATAAMKKIGSQPRIATPAQFAELIKKDTATWAEVIKAANIKIE